MLLSCAVLAWLPRKVGDLPAPLPPFHRPLCLASIFFSHLPCSCMEFSTINYSTVVLLSYTILRSEARNRI